MMMMLSRAVQRHEGLESLQVFGLLRMCYAVVWLWYRNAEEVAHPTAAPHLMGHSEFLFSHNRLLMHVHAVSSALLMPFVAVQVFGRKGSSTHKVSGRLVAALVIVACPFNVALLCQNRYAWWLTTLVETLVLTQWLYHLAKLCATAGASHRWHGVQFVRMWLTPVDVRIVTSLALSIGTTDPVVATVVGHVGALALWMARLSPRPVETAQPRMPHVDAPRRGVFDLESLPAIQVLTLSIAHLLVGSDAPVDEVRMLAHGRPQTLLVILIGAVLAFIGGLQLLGLWAQGDLGDWDWTGLAYVLPLGITVLQFSERFYDGEPLARAALPTIVLLSISPPFAAQGLIELARDIKQAMW